MSFHRLGTTLCLDVPMSAGVATCPQAALDVGTAHYSGDARFRATTSPPLHHVVGRADTTVVLTSPADPVRAGSRSGSARR